MPQRNRLPQSMSKKLLTFDRQVHILIDKGSLMDTRAFLTQIATDLQQIREEREQLTAKLAELDTQERALMATHAFYSRPQTQRHSGNQPVPVDHLAIAPACEVVFREIDNRWMTLGDLESELRKRGKLTQAASIELALKSKMDRFEREKRGKRYFYRLRPGKVVALKGEQHEVEDSRATKA